MVGIVAGVPRWCVEPSKRWWRRWRATMSLVCAVVPTNPRSKRWVRKVGRGEEAVEESFVVDEHSI
jgi:hypothetical protein